MTVYELLATNKSFIEAVTTNGISIKDAKYLPLYTKYKSMRKENIKSDYIIALLCEEYDLKSRAVYRIIATFEKHIQI